MKPDRECMQRMAHDIAEALDKHEDNGMTPARLAAHQLEAINTVLAAMLVDFSIPVEVGQRALARAYQQLIERDEDESIH
jgi:hypothetical protein